MRLLRIVPLLLVCSVGLVSPADASDVQHGAVVTVRLRAAVAQLRVHRQTHLGSYDRDKEFGDWIEQGSGCDTRAVVLTDESRVPVTQNEDCTIETGQWRSYYNATTYTDASDLQVDHVVPVENVWVSGGWAWSPATRIAYYNDLADPRTLVAVDSHDNESKGDQTPDQWLPPENDCRYITQFVSVKLRWRLTATRAEKTALTRLASGCSNVHIEYTPAPIKLS